MKIKKVVPMRTPQQTKSPLLAMGLMASLGLGAAATHSTMVLPFVLGLAVVVVLATTDSYTSLAIIASALVVLLLAPLPSSVPTAIYFAGGSLYFADIISGLGILLICMLGATSSKLRGGIYIFCLMAALFLVVGLISGATPGAAFADVRGPLRLVAGAVVAYQLFVLNRVRATRLFVCLSALITVWTAVVVASIAFLGVSAFDIRTSNAAVYTTSKSIVYDTARVTPDSGLTCVVIVGCLLSMRLIWKYTPIAQPAIWLVVVGSGLFVGLVSYTRGHFLVLALILLLMTVVSRSRLQTFVRIGTGALIVTLFAWLAYGFLDAVDAQYARYFLQPLSAFRGKVLDGLLFENVQVDTSALWRVRESQLALEYFSKNWIIGSGFGARYRTFTRGEIFDGVRGLTYIHNGYLWILVKTGLIGAIAVLLAGALAIRRVLTVSQSSGLHRATVLGLVVLAALATQMITSPTIIENANSLLVGIIVGSVGYSLRPEAKPDDAEPVRDMKRVLPGARVVEESR
jgi:hypothetical protein